jgi:hypothetical protein
MLLECYLNRLTMEMLQEIIYSYMDDVNLGRRTVTSSSWMRYEICSAFEAASEAILNHNCKSLILGLGSWAGRRDWPLLWLQVASFGVVFTHTRKATISASWDRVIGGIKKFLHIWQACCFPTLRQRARPSRSTRYPRPGTWLKSFFSP